MPYAEQADPVQDEVCEHRGSGERVLNARWQMYQLLPFSSVVGPSGKLKN